MLRLFYLICLGALASAHDKCKISDDSCILKMSNNMYKEFFSHSNELDPMEHEAIEGEFAELNYTLKNTSARGFKNCKVGFAHAELGKQKMQIELHCPGFVMNGKYNITGRLINMPVQGDGTYEIETKKYRIKLNMSLELKPKDGKTYLNVKNFVVDAEALEPVVFKFENLFNGNKELADSILKYANENWKIVTKEMQGPVFQAAMKKIFKVANDGFKTNPLEEYVIFE